MKPTALTPNYMLRDLPAVNRSKPVGRVLRQLWVSQERPQLPNALLESSQTLEEQPIYSMATCCISICKLVQKSTSSFKTRLYELYNTTRHSISSVPWTAYASSRDSGNIVSILPAPSSAYSAICTTALAISSFSPVIEPSILSTCTVASKPQMRTAAAQKRFAARLH